MERFFITRPVFAIALSVAMVLAGVVAIENLSVEQYPDITPPVVEVAASYPGADAQTVDESVAQPLGSEVMGVSDMLYMQSTAAADGSMNLQVTFAIGSDPDLDAIFTQNRVSEAAPSLPATVTRRGVTTQKTMSGFLMVYALYSDGRYDEEFLSNYAYLHIRDQLLKVEGVGKVQVMGAGEYAMRIWLRPDLLAYYDLTVAQVAEAISRQSGIYPAGKFGATPAPEGTPFTYSVLMPPQLSTPEEFAKILLRELPTGEQVRLSDVASVELGAQSYGSTSAYAGKPSALVVVYQQPGSNAVEVGRAVSQEMERLKGNFYDGMAYATMVDSTSSIRAGIKDIFLTLFVALLLVVGIIYLFLQDWRSTLIPLVAIPVSLISTFALFPLLDFSINIISLLGMVLAIGLVVDDAIVVVEAVQLNLQAGMTPRKAAAEAMRRVASPIIATTVVLLAVFIPVSFTGGITGLLFRQFGITLSLAVVFSAINALSLSPALCALILKPHPQPERGFFYRFNRLFDRMMARYDGASRSVLRHAWRSVALLAVLGVAILLLWRSLPSGFLPEEDQGYLMVMVEGPEASSLERTQQAMAHVEQVVQALPQVLATSYAAGFNMMAGVASSDSGVLFVSLVDYKERNLSAMELAEELNGILFAAVPEAQCYAFIPPSIPGLGVSSGITLEVQDLAGQGAEALENATRAWISKLEQLPGVASVTTPYNGGVPNRRLVIDKEQALALGVDLGELYTQIATLLGGDYLNNFSAFGTLYQTYLQAAPPYRLDGRSLNSYYIAGRNGSSVPLSQFIRVEESSGPDFVTRFNNYRSIGLTVATTPGTSSGKVMSLIERSAREELPREMGFSWSGISFQQRSASSSGWWVYLLALCFVFLTLASLYNSWGMPPAILLGVPPAIFGALLLVAVAHLFSPLILNDLYLQISLVMLIGLAAKNAILVAEYADRLFFEQGLGLEEAALGAAHLRLRPILMTAFAFVLGVLPLVFAHGVYSTARHVMGWALVGGMTMATLLGVFLYPALYYLVARLGRFDRKRERLKLQAQEKL